MLRDDDRVLIVTSLTATLSRVPVRQTLQAALPVEAMRQLRDDLGLPGSYAEAIVTICEADQWNNSPPWLLRLLGLLTPTAEIDLIRARLENPPRPPDPWTSTLLVTEMPFLDRGTVRTKLARLNSKDGALKPILVVGGATRSGKSWTRQFIEHLYYSKAAKFEYVLVRFRADQGAASSPEALARDILGSFSIRTDSLPSAFFTNTTNLELWPGELAKKVLSEARKDGTVRWIVLDGFAGETLRDDTRKFIIGLAEQLTASSLNAESFRLILLGFDRPAATLGPGRVDPDTTQPVTQTDVLTCVNEILAFANRPQTEADDTLQRVMRDLPNGEARMEELQLRLADVLITARDANV